MPDELTEYLIGQAESTRDIKRQLGDLAKVTGIQTKKVGVVKVIRKRWMINQRSVAGDGLIWGNTSFGIWGTGKWNPGVTGSSFVLGNSVFGVLGSAQLGSQGISDWETYEVSDYPELLSPSIVSWYPFENGAEDIMGSKDGTITNATLTTGPFGETAYSFDGATTSIALGLVPIPAQASHSFSAWIYLDPTWSAQGAIVGGRRGDATSFCVNANRKLECREDDYSINSVSTIPLNTWVHVVYTYQGGASGSLGTMSCYIDGVLDYSKTETHTGDTWTSLNSWIGYESRFSYYFKGKISEVIIFSKALSSAEISILYSAGGKV